MIEEDDELLEELVQAGMDEEIPGLLNLRKTWHALDFLVSGNGRDPVLGDAILGRSGDPFGGSLTFGRPRVLEPDRVRDVNTALQALPPDIIKARYATLHGHDIHGRYGQERLAPDDVQYIREKVQQTHAKEMAELQRMLDKLKGLYKKAAAEGHSVMLVVVA